MFGIDVRAGKPTSPTFLNGAIWWYFSVLQYESLTAHAVERAAELTESWRIEQQKTRGKWQRANLGISPFNDLKSWTLGFCHGSCVEIIHEETVVWTLSWFAGISTPGSFCPSVLSHENVSKDLWEGFVKVQLRKGLNQCILERTFGLLNLGTMILF